MSRVGIQTGDEAARGAMYGLLARIWLREVDHELLQQLASTPLQEAFTTAGGVLPKGNGGEVIQQLEVDYCQLFIGPSKHLPPYQSVWQSGQFHGDSIESMRDFLAVCGYDADLLPTGIMLDHLGVQLDVMGHILEQIAIGLPSADETREATDVATGFFAAHLRWPQQMLLGAQKQAQTEFYRSAILLTDNFLKSESGI